MDMETIAEAVDRFRALMDRCHGQFGILFGSFPRGCCGDVSSLHAAHLKDEGLGIFAYISGTRNGQSHAWLERDGIIVDATADQFQDGTERPMVTDDPTWHLQFYNNLQRRKDGDFRLECGAHHLDAIYNQINMRLMCDREPR